MAAERATALVIRGTDWSETSRITTLWTREFGKVRALAKGGRRLQSSFEVAFDLLTVCEVMFLRKAHGGLDLLTEATVRERFPQLRTDLRVLYCGYYFAELLADGTFDYDPHPQLFDATLETLRKLGNPTIDRPAAVSAFELVWLRELGYSPRLEECAVCGTPVEAGVRVPFSPSAGGALCPKCAPSTADRRWLSADGRATLGRLATDGDTLPAGVRTELRQLLSQMVSSILGRRPKMLAYLDGVG
ncbi:DNA repair protein RecO [Limnoglobus roseus]|uniref:DNA repair protein RecO n=1 Tax=Limnoglobus roseus TaxID=2598579 RepID=A0A5C1AK57_9BACT|nr:DNA repair protein RecO [Limnoglobus roseus]QEL19055.1 DNA repair protein RecO [Limnoglobus roseus]